MTLRSKGVGRQGFQPLTDGSFAVAVTDTKLLGFSLERFGPTPLTVHFALLDMSLDMFIHE